MSDKEDSNRRRSDSSLKSTQDRLDRDLAALSIREEAEHNQRIAYHSPENGLTRPEGRRDSYFINMSAISGTLNDVQADNINITGVKVIQQISLTPAEHLPELWKVPSKNINFIGRSKLLQQIEHHFSKKNTLAIITAFHGLGGVGKTQLALQFVWNNYKNYKGVIWFNAESQDQLKNDYISLGRELNIFRDEENIDDEELARHVKHWLEDPSRAGWLLVYDNAPNYDTISELLPTKEGKLLVTSRYTEGWPHGSISVNVFTIEESRAYIQKILGSSISESDIAHIDTLADVLGRLPLALAIACAYIKNNMMRISRYLELYEERKQYILSIRKSIKTDQLLSNSEEGKQFTSVYITWDITMEKIHKESLLATNWLNACACLASNDIPHFLLKKFAKTPENNPTSPPEIFEEALGTLNRYSMLTINEQNSSASIHRLVQEVIRLKWGTEESRNNLMAVYHLLIYSVPEDSETMEDYAKKRQLLPHLEVFLPHIDAWQQEESPELQEAIEKIYLLVISLSADWYFNLGNAQKAQEWWERALEIKERHYGPDHFEVASTLTNLGTAYFYLRDTQKQRELLERALVIKEKHYGPDHFDVAITLTNLGIAYGQLGDTHKQRELLERALAINERHYSRDHFEVATTLVNLGNAYGELGDTQKKRELLERALEIKERHYGPDHFKVATTLVNLGNAYGGLGDAQKQRELHERALVINERHYGPNHFQVATTLESLATVYGYLGDAQKERELLERALEIQETYYGPDHFEVATTLANLGTTYGDLGDTQKKQGLLERALAIFERHYGPDDFRVAATLVNLGNAYGDLGNIQKQLELLKRALKIQERHYSTDHFNVAITLMNLGIAYGRLGDIQKKRELLERALVIKERHYGPNHFQVAKTLGNLGDTYRDLGDTQKACEVLELALQIFKKHYGSYHLYTTMVLEKLNLCCYLRDSQKKWALQEQAAYEDLELD